MRKTDLSIICLPWGTYKKFTTQTPTNFSLNQELNLVTETPSSEHWSRLLVKVLREKIFFD